MTHQNRAQRLKSFFSANFHQDWMLDAAQPGEVVERYRASANPGEAVQLADDIKAYVAGCADDADLCGRLFQELGCYYDPRADGMGARDWMLQLAEALSR